MSWDYVVFQQINNLVGHYAWLDTLGIFFAEYFGYVLVGSLTIFLVVNTKKYWPMVWRALVAAIISRFVITEAIRWLWERPRPFVEHDVNLLIGEVNHAAFPSGHAAFYFGLAAAIFFYNKRIGVVFLGAAAVISLARVFVGVHWPFDILAGALIGCFIGWAVSKGARKIKPS